ncbi:MAG: response regulator transcription factor [Desulfobacteria bacterium]
MSIRILLADDHRIMREGLRSLIENEPDMKVVAEAGDGRTTVRLAEELSPDVAVIDITMPELNGIEASSQIIARAPHIKVLALSMHSDEHFVTGMLRAGASGYLLKDCAAEELCRAIRSLVANETHLSPKIASIVIEDYRRGLSETRPARGKQLTPREREVLQLVAEGETSKKIAAQLHVSVKTVDAHRQQIMDKLDIRSVAGLTKYAIRKGITYIQL